MLYFVIFHTCIFIYFMSSHHTEDKDATVNLQQIKKEKEKEKKGGKR